MNKLFYGAVLFISCALALLGTPVAKRVALRYNLLDFPDGRLKKQAKPVPYMGGVVVYFSLISAVSLFFPFDRKLLGILLSSSILLLVGLFDDFKALTPGIKFLFQLLSTYILVKSGILINLFFIPQWINVSLTFLVILTVINAFNIIDVIDGLAASVGIVSCLAIFLIALFENDYLLAILAASLAGALLGFLKFNWEPAQIYLGDAGSMVVGLIVGSLAIMGSYTTRNDLAFVAGFLILGIPLFDLVYVVVLRLVAGRSPFKGSPDHLALRLRKGLGLSAGRTVIWMAFLQILLSGLAVVDYFSTQTLTLVSTGGVALALLVFGWLLSRVKME